MHSIVNTQQAEAWNGYEGGYWADHQDRYDAVNAGFNDCLFEAAAIGERDRVLDVGCGNGQTTRLAARRAPRGSATGVDLSAPMLARAGATAAAEGITNVTFEQGDAQVHPFPSGGFDVAISRFAIMFFTDPVAAFANIGRAIRPGGRLTFLCMQDMSRNDWLMVMVSAMAKHVPPPNFADPNAPGMFSLADPARIGEVLTGAGYEDVTTTPVEAPMLFGRDADDAAEFLFNSGPFGSCSGGPTRRLRDEFAKRSRGRCGPTRSRMAFGWLERLGWSGPADRSSGFTSGWSRRWR